MKAPALLIAAAMAFGSGAGLAQSSDVTPQPSATAAPVPPSPPASTTGEAASRPRGAMLAGLQKSCAADFDALCPGLHPGDGKLGPCIRSNMAKLSPVCASALRSMRTARQAAPQ